jgi:hypothetical protein
MVILFLDLGRKWKIHDENLEITKWGVLTVMNRTPPAASSRGFPFECNMRLSRGSAAPAAPRTRSIRWIRSARYLKRYPRSSARYFEQISSPNRRYFLLSWDSACRFHMENRDSMNLESASYCSLGGEISNIKSHRVASMNVSDYIKSGKWPQLVIHVFCVAFILALLNPNAILTATFAAVHF